MPSSEERIKAIRQAVANGTPALEAIANQVSLEETIVYRYAITGHMPTNEPPKTRNPKRKPVADALIGQGETLKVIHKAIGISIEAIRIYIGRTSQYDRWKGKSKERKRLRRLKIPERRLISVLKYRVLELAKEEGYAYEKAFEVIYSRKTTPPYPYSKYITLFQTLKDAKDRGIKLSLEELAEASGLKWGETVREILKSGDEEAMYGTHDRNITPPEKRDAIIRGFNLKMPKSDIAYFVDVPIHVVKEYLNRAGTRPIAKPFIVRRQSKSLTYRLASQIYEARDLDFRVHEIAQLFDTTEHIVNYALDNRQIHQKTIIDALRILHANDNINKPYL